jgi:uncharacterized protein (DUF2141 family)
MTGRSCLILVFFLLIIIAAAGCMTLSVGNVAYGAGNLTVTITNTRDPVDTGIQVRVYKLDEFAQHELQPAGTTVTLTGTENTVAIPLHLDPGQYKIYVYLMKNGERVTAVIRDIMV